MKIVKFVTCAGALLLGNATYAQINVPVSNVGLAFWGTPGQTNEPVVTIKLGTFNSEAVIPTPFILHPVEDIAALWFCIDPYQYIYYNGYGSGNLIYESNNPDNFDLWTSAAPAYTGPTAPGLSTARKQDLADLFQAYNPSRTDSVLGGALQLAVWEIVDEPTGAFSLATGQFTASHDAGDDAVYTLATTMLNRLNSNDPTMVGKGSLSSMNYLIDGYYQVDHGTPTQDLISYTPPPQNAPPFSPIPESDFFVYGVVGLLSPLIVRQLRRRSGAPIQK